MYTQQQKPYPRKKARIKKQHTAENETFFSLLFIFYFYFKKKALCVASKKFPLFFFLIAKARKPDKIYNADARSIAV